MSISQLSLGPSVVEKVVDSRYWYNTDAMVPDFDLGIGDPMGSPSDGKIGIESVSVSEPDFDLGIGIGWKQPILPRILADLEANSERMPADGKIGFATRWDRAPW